MNPYAKTIGQIASIFGVLFVIFAAFAAIVNYEGVTAQSNFITPGILEYYVLNAMLPYLLFAAMSFTVAGVIMRASKEEKMPEEAEPAEAATGDAQPEASPLP